MGHQDDLAGFEIGGHQLVEDLRLGGIREKKGDQPGPLAGLFHGSGLDSVGLGLVHGVAVGPDSHHYLEAAVLEVEGVGPALGTVAQDGDLLVRQAGGVGVFGVIDVQTHG